MLAANKICWRDRVNHRPSPIHTRTKYLDQALVHPDINNATSYTQEPLHIESSSICVSHISARISPLLQGHIIHDIRPQCRHSSRFLSFNHFTFFALPITIISKINVFSIFEVHNFLCNRYVLLSIPTRTDFFKQIYNLSSDSSASKHPNF